METKRVDIVQFVVVVLLGVLLAFNYILFINPNNFAPAGINGIAVMIQYKFNFSVGYMSLIINVPLCIFAFFLIEKKFSIKTLFFCVVYSLTYLYLQTLDFSKFQYNAQGIDTIYPVIIAGLLSGLVYGFLFKINACTGGTDIVAKYLSKKKPFLNFFWVMFSINAAVAIASCFVYAENGFLNYKPACLCMLYCFVSSFIGNAMLKGAKSAYNFTIVTSQPQDLEKEILKKLRHSATRVQGQGIYSNEEKTILTCLINKHQLVDFENIIKKYPEAFVYVQSVSQTFGNFKRIK
ncbi:MAG: YitT family protein [Clostridiales bacterium]|nr:YitT family protein [Clostridiales bacterium]